MSATEPAAATPGRAAYEAWRRTFSEDEDWSPPPWDKLSDEERVDWEAAAQAAIDAWCASFTGVSANETGEPDVHR